MDEMQRVMAPFPPPDTRPPCRYAAGPDIHKGPVERHGTVAAPSSKRHPPSLRRMPDTGALVAQCTPCKIGRASCRERVKSREVACSVKYKNSRARFGVTQ